MERAARPVVRRIVGALPLTTLVLALAGCATQEETSSPAGATQAPADASDHSSARAASVPPVAPNVPASAVPADDPAAADRDVTLRVSLAAGRTLWFVETAHHERTLGEPSRDRTYVTEVSTLWSAEGTPGEDGGTALRLKFARIWGYVDDGSLLAFDTDGEVPKVFCRLDDVLPEIALKGREFSVLVGPDGRLRFLPTSPLRTEADLLALRHVRSMIGAAVPYDQAVAPGGSWESADALPTEMGPISWKVTTTLASIHRGSVRFRQEFSGTTGAGASARAAAAGISMTGGCTGTGELRIARDDGLVVSSDESQSMRTSMRPRSGEERAGELDMRHDVRTRVERVQPPAQK
jgi:hypothetical protein